MKRTIVTIIFGLFCLSMLFSTNLTAATVDLTLSHSFSPKHTMQAMVFEPWAEKINKETNGQIKVTMMPGGALGKPGDQYSIAEKGIADMVYLLHDYSPNRFPVTSVFELPFMTPTAERAAQAMWKTYVEYPDFQKEYSKVKVLALFCHPAGHFHTSKKPIRSIADFKGIKMRTASPYVTEALKKFGAIPVEMPITDTYTSVERGVVDGTVVPFEGVVIFKLNDLLKYSTLTDFYTVTMAVLMNQRKWDSLPADVKKVIDANSGLVMSTWCGREYDKAEQPMKQIAIKSGMEMIELPAADMQQLRDMTLPLREEWVKSVEDRGLSGRPILNSALKNLGIQ